MTDIMSVVVPIILLLFLGYLCKKKNIVSEEGIRGIKTLSINFLWPIVLFYAFFTADYSVSMLAYAGSTFFLCTMAFLAGMLLRRKIRTTEHSFCYPYLMSGSEIGMLGYSLYILLFGAEHISQLAVFDVGHAFFIFPIFLSCLNMEQGKGSVKESFIKMLKQPLIIMLAIGLICGISGFGKFVMNSEISTVIDKIYNLASSANVVTMLAVMGYGISFSAAQLKKSIRFIAARAIAMTICCIMSLLFIQMTVGLTQYTMYAAILTFILPPVYMLSVYVEDRKENEFISTTTSIYTVLSIAVFMVISIFK